MTFIHGTFFEIAVCVFISVNLVNFWDYLNKADKMSAYFAYLFLLILVGYIAFAIYFTLCRSKDFAFKHRSIAEEEQKKFQEDSKDELLDKILKKRKLSPEMLT